MNQCIEKSPFLEERICIPKGTEIFVIDKTVTTKKNGWPIYGNDGCIPYNEENRPALIANGTLEIGGQFCILRNNEETIQDVGNPIVHRIKKLQNGRYEVFVLEGTDSLFCDRYTIELIPTQADNQAIDKIQGDTEKAVKSVL